MKATKIVGHRGAMAVEAENTRGSFDAAVAAGVHGIEFDLQLTGDGVPVVYHDRTLARVGMGVRRVAGLTLGELRGASYPGGGRIMTFEEVLCSYTGTCLFIEIKVRGGLAKAMKRHTALVDRTVSMIMEHNVQDRARILCFYPEIIRLVKERAPGLFCIHNIDDEPGWHKALAAIGTADGVCSDIGFLSEPVAAAVHRYGKMLLTYSCNTPDNVKKAVGFNSDIIMTDNPSWLVGNFEKIINPD